MKSFCLLISFGIWMSHIQSQYQIYDSPHNQIAQSIIRTGDGGFLIASIEFCYTPDEWVIEGCPIGIQLVKTDNTGDTLWINEILNYDILGPIHLFENGDGTYTIFAQQDGTYTCHEWVIGPDFGLVQVMVYHINAEGEQLSETAFPDDCQLQLFSVERLNDSSFVMLTKYSEPFASDSVEGRLHIIDQYGTISHTHLLPGEPMDKSDLMVDSQNQVLLIFIDRDSALKLNLYDENLVIVQENINADLDSSCLIAEGNRFSAALLQNGNVFVMCDNPYNEGKNVELFTFNQSLDLLSNKQHTIPFAANFIESAEGEIIIGSEYRSPNDSSDIKLSYFSANGDSLHSRIITIAGNQTPYQIMELPYDEIAVVGTHNCCNLNAATGPGLTFLYLGEESTSASEPRYAENAITIFPNPVQDFVHIRFDESLRKEIDQAELYIYSVTGALMEKINLTGIDHLSLSKLKAGSYFLVFEIDNMILSREKFIKIY